MNNALKNRYARWRRYRRTLNELSGLTNRDLHDLGIARAQIPHIAREASRG